MKHAPAHAGKLPGWERSVFGLLFALMAAFVVVSTVSAARSAQADVQGSVGLPGISLPPGGAGNGVRHFLPDGGIRGHRTSGAATDKRLSERQPRSAGIVTADIVRRPPGRSAADRRRDTGHRPWRVQRHGDGTARRWRSAGEGAELLTVGSRPWAGGVRQSLSGPDLAIGGLPHHRPDLAGQVSGQWPAGHPVGIGGSRDRDGHRE